MARRFLTILTGRNLPKIRQSREPEPSTINEKDDRGLFAPARANGSFGGRNGGPAGRKRRRDCSSPQAHPRRSAQAGSLTQDEVNPFAARAEAEVKMTSPDTKAPD